ncbi:PIG-L family deacetylase [Krasilnikoviella flava]|uniref:N-acetyl-1-D-myo-inositol-2-amino-2-deoxy-alpha-D-glucopyranoside deacetylase n=1 Tax=Krasilnikoviella flava TaxID=526729 RepID=A0A1T5JLX3_9MICO|nr:PIG-L family deacetylase [Krasilnikoviella flava]SKC52411.1 N-acetyl-1-D-myo-inositol-2-amino-2-deoxy-alpha-D-glucopyranoside deacetylase [Krasilnikoviella flava]
MTRPASPGLADGLLAVHAHPDDETLATGALLASRAAAGRPVTVVTCTRGERGEVIDTPSHPTGLARLEGDGPALAAHRETELAAAVAALGGSPGVVGHAFLDTVGVPGADTGPRFEDSGMAWVAPGIAGPADDAPTTAFARVPLEDAAARLAALVRTLRPAVVATYEERGGYGHPDHVRVHGVVVRALSLAADPGAPLPGEPWGGAELWQAVAPSAALRAGRRALAAAPEAAALAARAGLTFPDADEPLPPLATHDAALAGDDPADVAVRTVDVAPVLDRVLAAMGAHATQVQHATRASAASGGEELLGWYALSNEVLAPVLAREHYLVSRPVVPRPEARR